MTARDDVPFFGPTLPSSAIFDSVSASQLLESVSLLFVDLLQL